MNSNKSYLERNSHLQSLKDGSLIKINMNGQKSVKLATVAFYEGILISPDMYHVSADDYLNHVCQQSTSLDPSVGRYINNAKAIFDTLGEHSKFRTYFIDPDLVSSKKIRFLNYMDNTELRHLLKDLLSGKRNILDFRYFFNYITFINHERELILARYNCTEDSVNLYLSKPSENRYDHFKVYTKDKFSDLSVFMSSFKPIVNLKLI